MKKKHLPKLNYCPTYILLNLDSSQNYLHFPFLLGIFLPQEINLSCE